MEGNSAIIHEGLQSRTTEKKIYSKEKRKAPTSWYSHNVLARGNSAEWIFEADIKGCFDNISHDRILQHIPLDKKVLGQWLKSGYIDNKNWFPTESGTPQ